MYKVVNWRKCTDCGETNKEFYAFRESRNGRPKGKIHISGKCKRCYLLLKRSYERSYYHKYLKVKK